MPNITKTHHPRQPETAEELTPTSRSVVGDNPMHEIRRRRAVTLVPTVRPVAGGYRVASARG